MSGSPREGGKGFTHNELDDPQKVSKHPTEPPRIANVNERLSSANSSQLSLPEGEPSRSIAQGFAEPSKAGSCRVSEESGNTWAECVPSLGEARKSVPACRTMRAFGSASDLLRCLCDCGRVLDRMSEDANSEWADAPSRHGGIFAKAGGTSPKATSNLEPWRGPDDES